MSTFTYELGLGGRFRQLLITEADVVSVYPLSELVKTTARDIAYDKNPGTWMSASGATRGVSVDALPEGALSCLFDGETFVEVLNDGEGYRISADDSARNLSCAGGDIDVVFLIKTSTSNAGVVVQKYDGTNGWYVTVVGGAVRFKLGVGGSQIFSVDRGSIADGAWHLVHCVYDSLAGEIKIMIDGPQSGATATCTPTDPALTSANFRIGRFNDDTSKLVATLAYVAISRQGRPSLSTDLQATRAWTDVSAHVRAEVSEFRTGMAGTTLKDRQAGIGTFSFTLNNTPKIATVVTQGYYTIGHANARSGFDLDIPVRFSVDGTPVFRGWIQRADPEAGIYGGRRVFVQAVDWFSVAAKTSVDAVGILTDVRSDIAYAALIDEADRPPVAVDLDVGEETFPFVFDRISGPMLSEMARIVTSEGGYAYDIAGTVTFEKRSRRQIETTAVATFNSTMREMSVQLSDEGIVNQSRITITPRRLGSPNTVLYSQTNRQRIPPFETLTIEGAYQDPQQSRSPIGGTNFEPFNAGTGYTFTPDEDGVGIDASSTLSVERSFGGSGFRISFTAGETDGWIAYEIRGLPLYTDKPQTIIDEDRDSVRQYGAHPYDQNFAYMNSADTARNFNRFVLQLFSSPSRVPSLVTFRVTSALAASVLPRRVGDLIALGESMTALSTTDKYWIQTQQWTYSPGGIVDVTFGVFPSVSYGPFPFAVWDAATALWDQCLWNF